MITYPVLKDLRKIVNNNNAGPFVTQKVLEECSNLETFVQLIAFQDPKTGFKQYIELNNFLKHIIADASDGKSVIVSSPRQTFVTGIYMIIAFYNCIIKKRNCIYVTRNENDAKNRMSRFGGFIIPNFFNIEVKPDFKNPCVFFHSSNEERTCNAVRFISYETFLQINKLPANDLYIFDDCISYLPNKDIFEKLQCMVKMYPSQIQQCIDNGLNKYLYIPTYEELGYTNTSFVEKLKSYYKMFLCNRPAFLREVLLVDPELDQRYQITNRLIHSISDDMLKELEGTGIDLDYIRHIDQRDVTQEAKDAIEQFNRSCRKTDIYNEALDAITKVIPDILKDIIDKESN